ncbi:MAG: hypothetical protein BGN87_15920 [Rhizobiales bacterium 65-79]|nr:MAG: hypothetical protein BGN87_15920 [Rhizobiales bacterium 65-79]
MNDVKDMPNDRWRALRRPSTRFLKRYIMHSDHHGFIGRIYDLSIVGLNFESYEEVARHPDCKYALDTNYWVSGLAARVESLNLIGDMLWLDPYPDFAKFPITQYDWLTVTTDVFLMRFVSVIDCALLLVNEVFRLELDAKQCTIGKLRRKGIPASVNAHLQMMLDEQEALRVERNARIHHGAEREFTEDDQTFRMAARFGVIGKDIHGRRINADRSFKEGLVVLQRYFNRSTRLLQKQLDPLYDLLWEEFEDHFGPLIAAATHGFNARSRHKASSR